jgi:hypothetical protein
MGVYIANVNDLASFNANHRLLKKLDRETLSHLSLIPVGRLSGDVSVSSVAVKCSLVGNPSLATVVMVVSNVAPERAVTDSFAMRKKLSQRCLLQVLNHSGHIREAANLGDVSVSAAARSA